MILVAKMEIPGSFRVRERERGRYVGAWTIERERTMRWSLDDREREDDTLDII